MPNPNNTTQPMEELRQILIEHFGYWSDDDGNIPKNEHNEAIKAIAKLIALQETKARINQTERCERQVRLIDQSDIRKAWFSDEVERLKTLNPNTDRKDSDE